MNVGRQLLVVLIIAICWCWWSSASAADLQTLDSSSPLSLAVNRPAGRALCSHPHTITPESKSCTGLYAAPDGTLYLFDAKSDNILWSFATGRPIYTAHQNDYENDNDLEHDTSIGSRFFLEVGDDRTLYYTDQHSGKTLRLSQTIDDFIKEMPIVSDDGAVTLGSKTTTVLVLDAKTGKLLRSFTSPSQTHTQSGILQSKYYHTKQLLKPGSSDTAEMQLHISRTDYELQSVRPNSNKDAWNVTVAEIKAALFCHDVDNMISTATIDFPLQCQSVVDVHHVRTLENVLHLPTTSSLMLALQTSVDESLHSRFRTKTLPASAPDSMVPLQHKVDKLSQYQQNNDIEEMLLLAATESDTAQIKGAHGMRLPRKIELSMSLGWPIALALVFLIAILVGFTIYSLASLARAKVAASDSNLKAGPSKKKKIRKPGKNSGNVEQKDKHLNEDDNKTLLALNKLADGSVDGRRIGKLFVSNTEIAKGSNGTIVLEGIYEGRHVAVKRLVQAHHDVAFKEIENLIASDSHPNIVRWYGVEYDEDFVYLSLERCTCNLDDLIQIFSDSSQNPVFSGNQATSAVIDYRIRLDSVKGTMGDLNLWKVNGYPSPLLLKLMRDIVYGLLHLHELGIIHRDIKPQNVLIVKEKSICAKLSDMGISKRLLADMSSLGHRATGCGSSGWQAPEQLLHGRQTRAMDMFSLGCVLFFCITGGRHPFGNHLERDVNIVRNQLDLFLVEYFPEARVLISHLLNPDPELRPSASEVLHHPLFWSSETRLSFLRDTSDRIELEDRDADSHILRELESIAPTALGGKWDEKMERAFITNIGHYRRYKYDSVRDLLRVMRNKLNHYRELPKQIQELVGPVPEGFDNYFASRFPRLLIEVHKVVRKYCGEEECFKKYFITNVI